MAKSNVLQWKIEVDYNQLQGKISDLFDSKTMLAIHNEFARLCDQYVPFLNGPLSLSAMSQVTPEYVSYGGGDVPYGRYQYYLETDNRTRTVHPKATSFWDKAMMAEQGDAFKRFIGQLLQRRSQELNG